jgi:hypothetical protein
MQLPLQITLVPKLHPIGRLSALNGAVAVDLVDAIVQGTIL